MKTRAGFTLLELLTVIVIIAILTAAALPVYRAVRKSAWHAVSAHTLQQLGAMGASYRTDNDGQFWRYRETVADGTVWWFGFESNTSARSAEGQRTLDLTRGPLGPYAIASGGVKSDPAFMEMSDRFKPKYTNGSFGYGYNTLLGGGSLGYGTLVRAQQYSRPADVVVFATCAQVNTFQAPASAKNPKIEEFYMIDDRETTVHFRFGGKALACMMDGSIRELPMDPSTLDQRMPAAKVGRFAPRGSKLYLAEQSAN